MRTLLRPQGAHAHLEYISLRVKSCVRVINKELALQMDIRELEDALPRWGAKKGRGRFWDTSKGWPISMNVLPELIEPGIPPKRARLEHEIEEQYTEVYDDVWHLPKDKLNKVVNGSEHGVNHDVDVGSIVIKSADLEYGEYNFVRHACMDHYFRSSIIYRVLEFCTFRDFCFFNHIIVGERCPRVDAMQDATGESIDEIFEVGYIEKFFGYIAPLDTSTRCHPATRTCPS